MILENSEQRKTGKSSENSSAGKNTEPSHILIIIINQIYLKRNTDNHMINKNKNKFQVSIAEDRKTQPEIARTD